MSDWEQKRSEMREWFRQAKCEQMEHMEGYAWPFTPPVDWDRLECAYMDALTRFEANE